MRAPKVSRQWFPLALASLVLATAAIYAARPLMSYKALDLGGGALEIGIITGTFSGVSLAGAVPIGRLIDRGYFRFANVIGILVTAGGCVVAAIADDLLILYLGSAILGVGQMLFLTSAQSMIPAWSPDALIDGRFGYVTLMASLGQVFGLALLPLVSDSPSAVDSTYVAMLAAAFVAAFALPMAALAHGLAVAPPTVDEPAGHLSVWHLLHRPGMRPAILSSLAALTGMDILTAYLPLVGAQLGFSVLIVAFLLGIRTTASVVARILLPWVLRTFPARPVLIMANAAPGVALMLIPLFPNVWAIGAIMLVAGAFWGVGQPMTMSWVSRAATRETRSTAISLRLAGNRAGQMMVPLAAGALAGVAGIGAIFVAVGLLSFGASLSTWVTTRPGSDGARGLSSSR